MEKERPGKQFLPAYQKESMMSVKKTRIVGFGKVGPKPWMIPGLDLKYCFESLAEHLRPGDKVLDVGCGAGSLTKAFKKQFPQVEVWGVDYGKKAIKAAKENNEGINFILANICKLPFKDQKFKAVIAFNIWEHLTDLKKAVQEIRRVLIENGLLYLVVPLEGDPWTLHGWLTKFGWQAKKKACGHCHYFNRLKLKRDFEKNDFNLLKQRNSGYLLHQLADIIFFSFSDFFNKSFSLTVEGFLEKGKRNLSYCLFWFLRTIFASLNFLESKVLYFLPGYIYHMTLRKKRKN